MPIKYGSVNFINSKIYVQTMQLYGGYHLTSTLLLTRNQIEQSKFNRKSSETTLTHPRKTDP